MFEVHAEYYLPLDPTKDDAALKAAGRMWDLHCCGKDGKRHLCWRSRTFRDALKMRKRLGCVPGIKATFREE